MRLKFVVLISVFISSFAYASFVSAETSTFVIDGSFDWDGRGQTSATLRHEGINAKYYVADDYWGTLSFLERGDFVEELEELSRQFDNTIYGGLTAVFGSENNPGIDGEGKIIVLMTKMSGEAGGYFREQDGLPKSSYENSNEREMVYLNAIHIKNPRMRAFLAHEFQHLITFNQKTIKHGIQEEVWLNELRSEIAPTLVGYDGRFVYSGSNLEARTNSFLKDFSDALLNWESEERDYASINLFGQYVLDRYGRSVLAAMTENNLVGIESVNAAMRQFGFDEDFSDVYTNWTITNLVNNCEVEPPNLYCYQNPKLKYDDVHINFSADGVEGDSIASQRTTEDWKSSWFEFETTLKSERPVDHIFKLDFSAPSDSNFRVPYVVYRGDGISVREINEMDVNGGEGTFHLKNFGYEIPRIVIIPFNQSQETGRVGQGRSISYNFSAATITDIQFADAGAGSEEAASGPSINVTPVSLPDFTDGTLIRAEGGYKVYVIKGKYKRWIQSSEIFDFYGHFNFAVVQEVPPETLALYEDAWLLRADGDTKVYEINGDGTRHWLDMSPEEFSISGRRWDMVYVINSSELSWYEEGASVK